MARRAVGVIGLGSLGGAMARRLVDHGWSVYGYDADPARLAAAGVTAAQSPAAVGAACDRVILSLPDSDAVEAVCLGEAGLIRESRADLLVVDTTSGYPAQTRAVASALAGQGVRMVDAAVTDATDVLPPSTITRCASTRSVRSRIAPTEAARSTTPATATRTLNALDRIVTEGTHNPPSKKSP